MSQTYMTVKLNLPDGAIVYPQVSLDNVVNSIDDPTLATIATGISISVNGGTATLVTNGGSGVAKFVGANGLVVSMNEGNEVVFTAPTVSEVDSAAYADNAGSAVSAGTANVASSLVSGYVATSATNATSAGTAAAIASGAIVAGWKNEIISGNTIGQAHWYNIINATGATVTVAPGEGYKVNAANSAVTISATLGTAGQWGPEGHMEVFVAGTGNVHTGAGVILADALEPDSVNNCTLRFHDGECIISVEDHIAGYIVVNGSTSGDGSLYYGITTSTNDYVAFDASLNGTVIPLAGAVAEGEKHIVGNGYTETAISGAIDCSTNKVTVANLSLQDVGITGGTLTLGDAYIPSGSTVTATAGRLFVEKLVNNGDFDCNGRFDISSGTITGSGTMRLQGSPLTRFNWQSYGFTITGQTFEGYSTDTNGPLINNSFSNCVLSSCTITGFTAYNGAVYINDVSQIPDDKAGEFKDCVFSGNAGTDARAGTFCNTVKITGCTFAEGEKIKLSNMASGVVGSVIIESSLRELSTITGTVGKVTVSSGAIIDLTGNTNATPINPGGGITFEQGGATVYPSAGQASAYMLGGMTVPQIGNTDVVNLNSQNVVISSGGTAYASGCAFTSGYNANSGGGLLAKENTILNLDDCIVSGCSSPAGGAVFTSAGGNLVSCTIVGNSGYGAVVKNGTDSLVLSSTTISGNSGTGGDIRLFGGTMDIIDCTIGAVEARTSVSFAGNNLLATLTDGGGSCVVTISSGASINLTSSIAPGGGIIVDGGCTVNGVEVAGGTYTSIVSSGGSAVVNS